MVNYFRDSFCVLLCAQYHSMDVLTTAGSDRQPEQKIPKYFNEVVKVLNGRN